MREPANWGLGAARAQPVARVFSKRTRTEPDTHGIAAWPTFANRANERTSGVPRREKAPQARQRPLDFPSDNARLTSYADRAASNCSKEA